MGAGRGLPKHNLESGIGRGKAGEDFTEGLTYLKQLQDNVGSVLLGHYLSDIEWGVKRMHPHQKELMDKLRDIETVPADHWTRVAHDGTRSVGKERMQWQYLTEYIRKTRKELGSVDEGFSNIKNAHLNAKSNLTVLKGTARGSRMTYPTFESGKVMPAIRPTDVKPKPELPMSAVQKMWAAKDAAAKKLKDETGTLNPKGFLPKQNLESEIGRVEAKKMLDKLAAEKKAPKIKSWLQRLKDEELGIKKYATGGWVKGSGNKDSIPAFLTPGEYVVSKPMIRDLTKANASSTPTSTVTHETNINVDVTNPTGKAIVDALNPILFGLRHKP
jgi:hypothetical protein